MLYVRSRAAVFSTATALVVGIAGCSSPTVPVRGVVTFDGKPLAKATVQFIPQETRGRGANGYTDTNGVFQLTTYKPNDGALPGLYKVVVIYEDEAPAGLNVTNPEDAQKAVAKTVAPSKGGIVIPAIYSQPDTTILQQRVPPDGEVKFELKRTKS